MLNKKIWALVASFCIVSQGVRAECRLDQLPANISQWIQDEQNRPGPFYASRSKKTLVVDNSHHSGTYSPSSGAIFPIKSYWVTEKDLHVSSSEEQHPILPFLKRITQQGTYYRFFVHPESTELYKDLIEASTSAPSVCATPTSSYRTLLVWNPEENFLPFFAKLSVDKVIGGEVRRVFAIDTKLATGVSKILADSKRLHPQGFDYLPEVLSVMPKSVEAGMLIRPIPETVLQHNRHLIPLFALYGTARDGSNPYLVTMLQRSKISSKQFIIERLLRPFARIWTDLTLDMGVAPEAHGQNTLVSIGDDGLLDGQFVWRDLDGFASKALHTTPKERNYWLHHSVWWFNDAVNVINFKLIEWMKAGLIPQEDLKVRELETALLHELHEAWMEKNHTSVSAPRTTWYVALRTSQYWEHQLQ